MQDKYYNMVKEAFQSDIAEKFFVTSELMKLLDDHKSGKAKQCRRSGPSIPSSSGTTSFLR